MDYHRVKGLVRLKKQIRGIPEAVKKASRDALMQNAADMAARIRQATPSEGVRRQGAPLKGSVGWTVGDAPKTKATGAFRPRPAQGAQGALNSAGLRVTVFAGDDEAFYARWVEFGTKPGMRDYQRKWRRPVNNRANRRAGLVGKRKVEGKRWHKGSRAKPFFYPIVRLYRKSARSRMVRAQNKAIKALRKR